MSCQNDGANQGDEEAPTVGIIDTPPEHSVRDSVMNPDPTNTSIRFSPRPNSARDIPWRPWSEAAFAEAQDRNRPILLCITTAWSQWSHLMDERAYSDDTVQYLVKTEFVPVRVDAAARPDIDRRYNRGGWPTTAFLTPEGELMAGATYIPVQEMRDFLVELAEEYRQNRDTIRAKLGALEEKRREAEEAERATDGVLTPAIPAETMAFIAGAFDRVNGGLGDAPKFTHTEALHFALEWCQHTLDYDLAALVKHSLDIMALSNLFDREDGVFFRFANDAQWENPERECTLEENAALAALYLEAAHVFRDNTLSHTATRVLQFMRQKLQDTASGAYSGGFFAPQEYYDLSAAQRISFGETCVDPVVHARENALAVQTFLEAYRTTGDAAYRDHATAILDHLWERMWDAERGIARNWDGACDRVEACDPVQAASGWGWLPEQTAAARAMVQAYETTGKRAFLNRALAVADHLLRVHHDAASGGFWDSALALADTPLGLLAQRQEVLADTAAASELLIRLWRLTNRERYRTIAQNALANYATTFRHFAHFAAQYGQAVDRLLRDPAHIVVIGSRDAPGAQALFQQAQRIRTPAQIVQWLDPVGDVDLLEARGIAFSETTAEARVYSGTEEVAVAAAPAELAAVFEQVERQDAAE